MTLSRSLDADIEPDARPDAREVRSQRHFSYFAPRMPSGISAAAFSFAFATAALLSVTAVGRPALLTFFGLTALLVLLFPYLAYRSAVRNAIMWVYAGWALFSMTWSAAPDRTLQTAILLLPTIAVGVSLGGIADRRAVNAGAAAALVIYIAYTLAFSATIAFADTAQGGTALIGLGSGKNFYGHLAAMSLLMAPSFMAYADGPHRPLAILATVVGLAASGLALVGSFATGSLVAALLALAMYPVVLLFRHFSPLWKALLLLVTVGTIAMYLAFGDELRDEIFNLLLAKFNKETTLTGRTFLWTQADRLIATHLWLGYGYSAFWHYSNPEAWTLWRLMGVQPMSGFNFHNTFRDTLINLGLSGLLIYLATFGYAFVRTAVRSLQSGELVDAVRLAFIIYFVVRMPVETTGIGATSVDAILLLTFLSLPLGHRRAAPTVAAAPPRRARPQRDVVPLRSVG